MAAIVQINHCVRVSENALDPDVFIVRRGPHRVRAQARIAEDELLAVGRSAGRNHLPGINDIKFACPRAAASESLTFHLSICRWSGGLDKD